MAANVMIRDGQVQMAAFGRIPIWWENGNCDSMQGKNANRAAKLMTLDEAYQLSGVDYEVDTVPNLFRDKTGQTRVGKGMQIIRTDTHEPLSYASESYEPIQNRDWFEILRPLMDRGEIAGIFTAGVLHRGEKAWVQACVDELDVGNGDRGLATLLLTSDHTRSGANRIGWNTTWVVCANTEGFAQDYWNRNHKSSMSCTHYGEKSIKATIEEIKALLDVARRGFHEWETVGQQLTQCKATTYEARMLAIAVMTPSKETVTGWIESPDTTRSSLGFWRNRYDAIVREFTHSPGHELLSRAGTAWGAFNAITSWVDFRGDNKKVSIDNRIDSIWYGTGKVIKNRAAEAAIAHCLNRTPWSDEVKQIAELTAV